jgi:hypothetical protein
MIKKREPPDFLRLVATSSSKSDGPSPAEGLRMLKAFTKIRDRTMRKKLIELAEHIALIQR